MLTRHHMSPVGTGDLRPVCIILPLFSRSGSGFDDIWRDIERKEKEKGDTRLRLPTYTAA